MSGKPILLGQDAMDFALHWTDPRRRLREITVYFCISESTARATAKRLGLPTRPMVRKAAGIRPYGRLAA